jgi:xylulokinase
VAGVGRQLTVGVDLGTTAVKAVAVDPEGQVLARSRVPHPLRGDQPGCLEVDARAAWRRGPRRALARVLEALERQGQAEVLALGITGMVPSLTAVDRRGVPLLPGVLYLDRRALGEGGAEPAVLPPASPGLAGLVAWAAASAPGAAGYWPAQAVAGAALGGAGAVDDAVALAAGDLWGPGGWEEERIRRLGAEPTQLPQVQRIGAPAGSASLGPGRPRVPLAAGSVDALCEQLVAGVGEVGEVLAIGGASLVVWVVAPAGSPAPEGLWEVPHLVPGRVLLGGPTNAGALFVDWAWRCLGLGDRRVLGEEPAPHRVPIWLPFPRGERLGLVPPGVRAALMDLEVGQGPGALRRAVLEASAFMVRLVVEATGVPVRRIRVTGGLAASVEWLTALAEVLGRPVEAGVPEGGALGAAFLAALAVGRARDLAEGATWARTVRCIEPRPSWLGPCADRYERFRALLTGAGLASAQVPRRAR